jgi:uncharacterized protein YndB with AHSA1/START domain
MKALQFSVQIYAAPGKVWNVLWNDETYREWTSAFSKGSYAVSDWVEGSTVHFLSPGGDGIYSTIEKLIPNQLMAFTHRGSIKAGEIQTAPDQEKENWAGAKEIYILNRNQSGTELVVSIDSSDSFKDYFTKTFPLALNQVKTLAEA